MHERQIFDDGGQHPCVDDAGVPPDLVQDLFDGVRGRGADAWRRSVTTAVVNSTYPRPVDR
ncbi:hypothetical protein GCM10010178_90140 [Lentzea flava]|uniref:Uncharacterized protein n=1 Tax=Lentzea flava TaxID=103732 RepID=A0ABQ2VHP0_9PSEU|nr:hypothetical protein GCM10010178_90140 [Lentzea flava]